MKTFKLLAASLLIAVCAGFNACGDDELEKKPLEPVKDEITISSASFDFEANGGEKTLSFSTNRDWTATLANTANGEKWCTVTPLNGKAGDNNMQIRVAANKGYDDRNVSLTIAAGGTSKTVIISQKQQDALTLTANKFEVDKNGGKINVEVKANIQYEVIISETSKSWISQSAKTRGLTSNNFSFDIAPSEEYDKRTGEIIIQSGELSETVHVYQSGEGVLLLTKSEYSVSDKGETIAVDLKSNFEFDVKMPDVDWVQSAAKTRGMSSHTLYYTIAPNETYDSREAEIIFYDKNSAVRDTLKIMQVQKDALIISKKEYNIEYTATILPIEVNTNTKYQYEIPKDCNWITAIQNTITKGLENYKIYFNIKENTTGKERKSFIIFKSQSATDTIRVTQAAKRFIQIKPELFFIASQDSTIEVNVNTNIDYSVNIPTTCGWVSLNEEESTSKKLFFAVSANLEYENREVEITLKDKQSALEQKFTIYQYKRDAIILSQKKYDIPAEGEIIEVDFKANIDCYAEIPYDCYDWIRQTTTRGLVGHKLYFDISANTTGEKRKGIIIINSGSNISDTISINQASINLSKTVNVEKAGSLPELISDNEKLILKELKVTGKINGTDIRFIREMAGRNEVGEPTLGSLTYLDLSDVRILEGGDWYYYDISYTDWQKRFIYTVSNEVGENMFRECKLQTVILPDNITAIRKYAFKRCSQLSKINIPDKVETLDERCFSNCYELKELTIPNGVMEIGYNAFYSCGFTVVTLPNSVTDMDAGAFENCRNLESVVLPNGIQTIGSALFQDCISLKEILIPKSVTQIYNNAFAQCQSLVKLDIPESVTAIMQNAFQNCKSLKTVTLPSKITFIGKEIFWNCTEIINIHSKMLNPISVDYSAFYGIDKEVCTLYVPQGSKSSYQNAEIWRDFKNIVEE